MHKYNSKKINECKVPSYKVPSKTYKERERSLYNFRKNEKRYMFKYY